MFHFCKELFESSFVAFFVHKEFTKGDFLQFEANSSTFCFTMVYLFSFVAQGNLNSETGSEKCLLLMIRF